LATISERILAFNDSRDTESISLKFAAMRENSFRFLRGTCHLFYEDIFDKAILPGSPASWLCGDLHLENFGSFKGSDKQVYFDINDFDEAILGPALWDVVRLLTSIRVAGNNAGFSPAYTKTLLQQLLETYFTTLQNGKPLTIEKETATGLVKELFEEVASRKEKNLVQEKTAKKNGYTSLLTDDKKLFAVRHGIKNKLIQSIQAWLNKTHGEKLRKVQDISFLVAGTGSIGVKRYLVLVNKPAVSKNYLLVIKQALPSSLQPYITLKQPGWKNEAERICKIQYRMQHVTPGDLNALSSGNDWYVTRWIQPLADKINFNSFIKEKNRHAGLMDTFGRLTASAQLRSSSREGSATADELIEFGTQIKWIKPLLVFSKEYALSVEKDYKEYCSSYDKGYFNFKK